MEPQLIICGTRAVGRPRSTAAVRTFFAFFLHCSAFFCFLGWCFFWTGANSQRHEKNCMWIGTIIRRSHQSPLDEDAIVRFRCICSAAFANAFFPCAEHVLHVTASAMLSACEAASTKHDVSARFARVCLIYCTHQTKNMTQYTKAVHNPCRTTMPIIQLEPFWGGAFSAKKCSLKIVGGAFSAKNVAWNLLVVFFLNQGMNIIRPCLFMSWKGSWSMCFQRQALCQLFSWHRTMLHVIIVQLIFNLRVCDAHHIQHIM